MKKDLAKGVVWDLTDIYSDFTDPKILENENKFKKWTENFNSKYRADFIKGRITPSSLVSALIDQEDFFSRTSIHSAYFNLRQSQDQLDEVVQKNADRIEALFSELSSQLLWFSLSLNKIPEKKMKTLLASPLLKNYKHHLNELRKFKKYQLSEKEEQVIVKKDQSGSSAFVQLYDKLDGMREFSLLYKGKRKKLNYEQISSIASNSDDRALRKMASEKINERFKQDSRVNAFILNTLIQDSRIERDMRGYKYPEQPTLLSYEIDSTTLESLVSSVTSGFPTCERYYLSKSKLTGIKKLYEWDRYNRPFKVEKEEMYKWEDAREMILESLGKLSPQFKDIANNFFRNKWIDAEVRPAKSSGGYCMSPSPKHHPYIFMNFTGTPKDVMTLAHELGHGIHNTLSSAQTHLNYHSSTAVAEIASIFCEEIVFRALYNQTGDPRQKINMLANRIQSGFATVFRQTAFYLFEKDVHTHRQQQGTLSVDEFNEYFIKRLQAMFGRGLILTKDHAHLWGMVSHFFHYNFYVFTYSMGELLSLALMAKYEQEGDSFIERYVEALKMGGSASPYEITKVMGVDISDKKFWDGGIELLDGLVNEFDSLVVDYGSKQR